MLILNGPEHLFTPAKAEETAAMLRKEDPEWTYTVHHDPKGTGLSFITVHDEDGNLLGKI